MGDSEQVYRELCPYGAEHFGNLDWIDTWMKESKAIYERIKSSGDSPPGDAEMVDAIVLAHRSFTITRRAAARSSARTRYSSRT